MSLYQIHTHLDGRWVPVGPPYREKLTAQGWTKFVKAFHYGARTKVVEVVQDMRPDCEAKQ